MSDLFQVTAECAYVTVDTPVGPQKTLLYKGGVFKADAPECKHLVDSGMAVPFPAGGSVGVDADGALLTGETAPAETPADAKPAGTKPAHGDPKADWVAYAVAQGMDEAEANKATKQDLVDALK